MQQFNVKAFTKSIEKEFVKRTFFILVHAGMYGSGFLVTGLTLDVLTLDSNSGLVCSSDSKSAMSHSQAITDCLRFHISKYNVAACMGNRVITYHISGEVLDFLLN